MRSRNLSALVILGASLSQFPFAAMAQSDYPNRPIRMVVPFASGGSTDVIARLLSDKLSEAIGKPLVIENRPEIGRAHV